MWLIILFANLQINIVETLHLECKDAIWKAGTKSVDFISYQKLIECYEE